MDIEYMDIAGILGILGFALALGLGILEIRHYRQSLLVRIREIDLIGSSRDRYLVLLRVTFVNPATRGRTVYHVGVGAPDKEGASRPPYEYKEGHGALTYTLPNNRNVCVDLSPSEVLWLPLDIPPNQSRSNWFAVVIQKEFGGTGIPRVHFVLKACDISGKVLAKFDKELELKTHTIS